MRAAVALLIGCVLAAVVAAQSTSTSSSSSCEADGALVGTNASAPLPVRRLFFAELAPATAHVLPNSDACSAALCECASAVSGTDTCDLNQAPSCVASTCIEQYMQCQLVDEHRTNAMLLAVLDARALAAPNRSQSLLFDACEYASCFLGAPTTSCTSSSAPSIDCNAVLDRFWTTRTMSRSLEPPTTTSTPAPPTDAPPATPLPTLPVPQHIPSDAFEFRATGTRTEATRDRLASALTTFAGAQVDTVVEPGDRPRQSSVVVRVEALELPNMWLAYVTVVSVGGRLTSAQLAVRVAARCADAVSDTPAKPPSFAAVGISLNAPSETIVLPFPVIEESSMEVHDSNLPTWAVVLAALVAIAIGILFGIVISKTACRVKEAPPLEQRIMNPRQEAAAYAEFN